MVYKPSIMSRIFYYALLKPLSLLPLRVLYLLSGILNFIIFNLMGYRKSVVIQNLRNSFPGKSDMEIEKIADAFFIHLCDVIVESIRLFSMPVEEVRRRFTIANTEILDEYYQKGKSVILVGGHYNNWEMAAIGFDLYSQHQAIGIYSPLSNKFFDKKFGESRSRYGVQIIPKKMVAKSFIANRGNLTMTIFGADQSPTFSREVFWLNFLNQETAVHVGTEVFAVKYNYPVIFFELEKVRRGHYQGRFKLLCDNPSATSRGEITALHTKYLEDMIREKPEYWLWSHKRWKRKRGFEELISTTTPLPSVA
jgi:KDO2-lipid IV(A) lauroyltransferase